MKWFINILNGFIPVCLTISGVLGFNFYGQTQERFNLRYDSGFPNTIFASVLEVDDGFVATGILGDSLNPFATPSIFAKFNLQGEFQFQKTYGGLGDYQLFAQNPDLNFLNDSTLAHSGITWDENNVRMGYLMKYNLQGDTTQMIKFYSPHIEEDYPSSDFISVIESLVSEDGHIYVLCGVVGNGTGNDRMVRKYTADGTHLWDYFYITPAEIDYILTFEEYQNKIYLVYKNLSDGNHHIITVDENGDEISEIVTDYDTDVGFEEDILIFDDYIYAASNWDEINVPGSLPGLYMSNFSGVLSWHIPSSPEGQTPLNRARIVKLNNDNTQLFMGGILGEPDSIPDDFTACLAKYTLDGEVLWSRQYRYLDLVSDDHQLYDMRATSDGGVIFCGESYDTNADLELTEPPYQQGWLVKVDEHGCLIEDCHLSDGTTGINSAFEHFSIGPNPTTDYLKIFINKTVNEGEIKIHDAYGRLIKTFHSDQSGTTLILNLTDLQKGAYTISLASQNQIIQTIKFFKL